MPDLETMVMSVVFIVFVVVPLSAAVVLVERLEPGFVRRQDYRFAAMVLGMVLGIWFGLLAGFVISNARDVGLGTLLLIWVSTALAGGLLGWCSEGLIHACPAVKQRRARF